MAAVSKSYLVIIVTAVGICILNYINESEFYFRVNSELQPFLYLSNGPSLALEDLRSVSALSYSYQLNLELFKLSSIDRTKIMSSQWKNPQTITSNTFIFGYCCASNENPQEFDCNIRNGYYSVWQCGINLIKIYTFKDVKEMDYITRIPLI